MQNKGTDGGPGLLDLPSPKKQVSFDLAPDLQVLDQLLAAAVGIVKVLETSGKKLFASVAPGSEDSTARQLSSMQEQALLHLEDLQAGEGNRALAAKLQEARVLETLKQLVKQSFEKVFCTQRILKLHEKLRGRVTREGSPGNESATFQLEVDALVSRQVEILAKTLALFRDRQDKALAEQVADLFESEIVGSLSHRFCYLKHLAFLQLLKDSVQLRREAKSRGFPAKLFRLFEQYTLKTDRASSDLHLFQLQAGPEPNLGIKINQIIVESYKVKEEKAAAPGQQRRNFNLNLKFQNNANYSNESALESGGISGQPQQYSNLDTAGTGIRQTFYRGNAGPSTQSRRLTQQDAILISSNVKNDARKKYESQSPIGRNMKNGEGSSNSRFQPVGEHSHLGSQEDSQRVPLMRTNQSPLVFNDGIHGIKRKITPEQMEEMHMRHNIHKINQINKLVQQRSSSEPPKLPGSGILNSRSLILPVEEENGENEHTTLPREEQRASQQQHIDHLNGEITENDLQNQQTRTQKLQTGTRQSQELIMHKDQKKRSSSSFIISNFFNGPLQGGQPKLQQHKYSALSTEGQNIRLQNLQGTPGTTDFGNHSQSRAIQQLNILPQQNSVAMTRLSRRQLSYGQNLVSLRQQQNPKFQTASNQVIQAYGDPRDVRFSASRINNKGETGQSSVSREDSQEDKNKGQHSQSMHSEGLNSERRDTISNSNHRSKEGVKSPMIPKLNLIQIQQELKMNKTKMNSSLGHQGIQLTAGGQGVLTTPGQQQRMNGMAMMHGPPLTSHVPGMTQQSPCQVQDHVFLDTSTRTNNIFGGMPLMLTSFNNAAQNKNAPTGEGQMSSHITDNRAFDFEEVGENGKPVLSSKHTQSFKQQQDQLKLKLHQQTTGQNLSEIETNGMQSMKILEGIPSGTLNLGHTQGTKNSNQIGMIVEHTGIVHNIGGALITNQDGRILGNNSITKMGEIASQLGEAFLSNDLSCLIKQQREMELEDQAEQRVLNQDQDGRETRTPLLSSFGVKRSKSLVVSGRMFLFNRKNSLLNFKQQEDKDAPPGGWPEGKSEKIFVTRTLMLNILSLLLQEYTCEEVRLINFNLFLQAMKEYMQSSFFQTKQCQRALLELRREHGSAGASADEGGSKLQQRRVRSQNELVYVNTLGMLSQTSDSAMDLGFSSETSAITQILLKFAFTNEDIMRAYAASQFVNFMDKEKRLAGHFPSKSIQGGVNLIPSLNMSGLGQLIKSPIKTHQMSYDSSDAEELFRLNRILATAQLDKNEADFRKDLPNEALRDLFDNPNQILGSNGILYDLTKSNKINGHSSSLGVHVPKEILRKKMDVLLYSTSQNIKNLIFKQTQETQIFPGANAPAPNECWWWVNSQFAQNLARQVSVLNCYIEERGQSRVLLSQIIDVSMESLLMIKRVLIDVTLKQNIFILDSSKQIFPFMQQELIQRGVVVENQLIIQDNVTSPDISQQQLTQADLNQQGHELQAQLATNLMNFRHLFSEFLKLLSHLLALPQTPDTLKLLNETFVGNDTWLETVKNFSISMWLQDIVSTVIVGLYNQLSGGQPDSVSLSLDEKYIIFENLESLRGINMLNFQEQSFFRQLEYMHNQSNMLVQVSERSAHRNQSLELLKMAHSQVTLLFAQQGGILAYSASIFDFFRQAQEMYFPVLAQQKEVPKTQAENGQGKSGLMSNLINRSCTRNMRNMTYDNATRNNSNQIDGFYVQQQNSFQNGNNAATINGSVFSGRQAKNSEENFPNSKEHQLFSLRSLSSEQKYWRDSTRKTLYQVSYWFTSTNGLLTQYLHTNSSYFKAIKSDGLGSLGLKSQVAPLNLSLTLSALKFLNLVFSLPDKFTKYTLTDEIKVFFIRTHHINFVRLYNKNKKYLVKLNDLQDLSTTARIETRTFHESKVAKLQLNQANSLRLCKAHLKCLYAIAKNRNQETREKIFKFAVLNFMISEFSLETEYKAQRKQFLSISKKTAKEANEAEYFDIEEANSPPPRHSSKKQKPDFEARPSEANAEHISREQGYILGPIKKMPSKFNEEIEQKMNQTQPGLDQPVIEEELLQKEHDGSSDSDDGLPPPLPVPRKTAGFKLAIGGLGLSTLAKDGQKTAEELADMRTLKQQQTQARQTVLSAAQNSVSSNSSKREPNHQDMIDQQKELKTQILKNNSTKMNLQDIKSETEIDTQNSRSDSDDGLPPPLQPSRPQGFALKLPIAGLGLSTVAKEGEWTAEAIADRQMLQKSQFEQKKAGPQEPLDESDSDDGLPPALPPSKPAGLGFKLALGGLTLSTLAKDGGRTAEELADLQHLQDSRAGVASKLPDSSSDEQSSDQEQIEVEPEVQGKPSGPQEPYEDSDSDAGLPPPLPFQKPAGLGFKLSLGGLGLSSIAKDGGRTAEEMADAATLQQSHQNKQQSSSQSSSPAESEEENVEEVRQAENEEDPTDSDDGLPPPIQMNKAMRPSMPALKIQGLGISTLAKDGGKTAEQLADLEALQQPNHKHQAVESDTEEESDSDDGLPPPLPTQKPPGLQLRLAIGGLGLSTLAKDGGQTAEQQADMNVLKQSQNPAGGADTSRSPSSASSGSQQQPSGRMMAQPEEDKAVDDSLDSDDGLPPPLPPPKLNAGLQMKLGLNLGGLGLSTVAKDGGKTAEELADLNVLKESQKAPVLGKQSSSESEDEDQDLSSDEQYYRELERLKGQPGGPSGGTTNYEGGSDEGEDREGANNANYRHSQDPPSANRLPIDQLRFNTLDQQDKKNESSVKQASDPNQPVYKLNIKNINKGALKINPAKLSNRVGQNQDKHGTPGNTNQIIVTPKQVSQQVKKPRYVVQNSSNIVKSNNLIKFQKAQQNKDTIGSSENESSHKAIPNASKDNQRAPPSQIQFPQNIQQKQPPGQNAPNAVRVQKRTDERPSLKTEIQSEFRHSAGKTSQESGVGAKNAAANHQVEDQQSVNTHVGAESIALQLKSNNNSILLSNSGAGGQSVQKPMFDLNVKEPRFREQPASEAQGNRIAKNLHTDSSLRSFNRELLPSSKRLDPASAKQESAVRGARPDLHLNQLHKTKTMKARKKKAIKVSKEEFYQKERQQRPIYQDVELHSLMLSLSICLLLQPQRGTLDELYCHQYPIDNGKENVLYILHQHLCHEANNDVIQSLLEEVHNISPPLAGQRLLKLMCPQLFDLGLYNNGRDWKKLAVGAYGVVYECSTNVKDPSSVAIKKMDLPVDVYDRCVLHDIFTEITCLEEFRLEKCVTDLYDYGVDRSSYYIVMKKYARSLGEWRRQQGDSIQVFQQNLSLYVSIYNQVLKALQTIHAHKVTHYDIKCDNVLIDFVGDQDQGDLRNMTEDDFQITFGDFGECRIFSDDKDEFCTRNRGTDSIKSPEMLQLAINTRKDHDKYDRRKQVGTNRLSDIWSAGCLFYELLTGEFLLYDPDFSYFFVKVVKPTSELFSEEKLKKIEHNQYIKDFLKFILIRDQRLRPTIDKVIKRFQHIHAILVGSSSYNDRHPTGLAAITAAEQIQSSSALLECLKQTARITESSVTGTSVQAPVFSRHTKAHLSRILESIFLCTHDFIGDRENVARLVEIGVTHVVTARTELLCKMQDRFEILELSQEGQNCFKTAPAVMDYIRKVSLLRGRLLFIENANDNLMKETILIALNHLFKSNVYETYNLIKSQNLLFYVEITRLAEISRWDMNGQRIRHYLQMYPQFSCHCGASLLILERTFAQYQNVQHLVACNCQEKNSTGFDQNGTQTSYNTCPCAANPHMSCQEYLNFLQQYFSAGRASRGTHVSSNPINSQTQLLWGFFDVQDFVMCPNEGQAVVESQRGSTHRDGGLDSKRSQGSSQRNMIPKIPISQALQAKTIKGFSGVSVPSLGLQNVQKNAQQQPYSDRLSHRVSIPQQNPHERQVAANISMTVDLNSIPVVTRAKAQSINLINSVQNGAGAAPGSLNLNSAHSLLSNTPEPQSGRIRHLRQPSRAAAQDGVPSHWEIKKCSICHCWTYAYNQALNKFAVLLNNRINPQALSCHGLLSHAGAPSHSAGQGPSVGTAANNLALLRHQFQLVEQEFVSRQATVQGIVSGGAAPSATRIKHKVNLYSQFSQNQAISPLAGNGNKGNLAYPGQEDGDTQVKNSTEHEQDRVRVPILEHLCIQLPF